MAACLLGMQVIARLQGQKLRASITCMIRHYVARRANVISDHPHKADDRTLAMPAARRLWLVMIAAWQ